MDTLKNHEIPGRVGIFPGKGGLPAIRVETDWSIAEIYQHGAHVTGLQGTRYRDQVLGAEFAGG